MSETRRHYPSIMERSGEDDEDLDEDHSIEEQIVRDNKITVIESESRNVSYFESS